jgi:hypothetical protein
MSKQYNCIKNTTIAIFLTNPVTKTSFSKEMENLATLCPNESTQVPFTYTIKFSLNIISWLGIFPVINGQDNLPCPPQLVKLSSLVEQAKSPVSQLAANVTSSNTMNRA